MEPARVKYQKLPGHRRGFIFGSSIWLGPDHLLLVKSFRFREEYRRFYFRDIQAIVTADAPRFHISTRSAWIGYAWLILASMSFVPRLAALTWIAVATGLGLIAAWIYLSAWQSCRCRIYTAVSSEDLRSLYRRWNARRFLEKVEPYLLEAQGALEPDYAEALDNQDVGPLPEGRVALDTMSATTAIPPARPPVRTPISTLLVAALCLGGAVNLAALGAAARVARPLLVAILVLQLAAAVAVIVENYRGRAAAALRNLAIVAAVAIGGWYYAVQLGGGIAVGYRSAEAARRGRPVDPATFVQLSLLDYPLSRGAAGAVGLLAGLAGVILLLRGERAPEEKVSFNV